MAEKKLSVAHELYGLGSTRFARFFLVCEEEGEAIDKERLTQVGRALKQLDVGVMSSQ